MSLIKECSHENIPVADELCMPPIFEKYISGIPIIGWDAKIKRKIFEILKSRDFETTKQMWKSVGNPFAWYRYVSVISGCVFPNCFLYPFDKWQTLLRIRHLEWVDYFMLAEECVFKRSKHKPKMNIFLEVTEEIFEKEHEYLFHPEATLFDILNFYNQLKKQL